MINMPHLASTLEWAAVCNEANRNAGNPEEFKTFNETVSKIKIVGDRYTGVQAQQTNK